MRDGDTLGKSTVNATHTAHLLNQAHSFGGNQKTPAMSSPAALQDRYDFATAGSGLTGILPQPAEIARPQPNLTALLGFISDGNRPSPVLPGRPSFFQNFLSDSTPAAAVFLQR